MRRKYPFSIAEIARDAGVSCATVSRVLNDQEAVGEELSARVLDLCGGALIPRIPSGTSLITGSDDPILDEPDRDYPSSIAGATASIVSSVVSHYPVPVDRLTQNEKLEIMELLNRKGVFLLKGSVSYVAKELHSSEASIYRYLGKINNKID